jgi:hypothetical protein
VSRLSLKLLEKYPLWIKFASLEPLAARLALSDAYQHAYFLYVCAKINSLLIQTRLAVLVWRGWEVNRRFRLMVPLGGKLRLAAILSALRGLTSVFGISDMNLHFPR